MIGDLDCVSAKFKITENTGIMEGTRRNSVYSLRLSVCSVVANWLVIEDLDCVISKFKPQRSRGSQREHRENSVHSLWLSVCSVVKKFWFVMSEYWLVIWRFGLRHVLNSKPLQADFKIIWSLMRSEFYCKLDYHEIVHNFFDFVGFYFRGRLRARPVNQCRNQGNVNR